MGDVSAEPSMEDILSSIKRIIAEEGEPAPARPRRQARPAPRLAEADDRTFDADESGGDEDEVLELNDPMPQPPARPAPPRALDPAPPAPPRTSPAPPPAPAPAPVEPIVSQQAVAATRGSLEALSRLMVKPEPASDGTLEGLVREMLKPMLREWLDANLPQMVEAMVAQEIAKITGRPD